MTRAPCALLGFLNERRRERRRQEVASMLAVDLREEVDETSAASPRQATNAKAKFLIRTLPKECNPTPVTASPSVGLPSGGGAGGAGMLSPKARKPSAEIVVIEVNEMENPFDDITEEKLQKLTGRADLSRVTSVQIAVDANKQSLEVIGELLPSLQQLRLLPGSVLHSFRDLGTSLHSLQVLWVVQCEISELDGIAALTGLQELHVQNNLLTDISPITMHDELRVVDLENNLVSDVGQIEQLAFCPHLASLTLQGNPLCRLQHYREIVASFLPQLTTLDGRAITDQERDKLSDDEVDAAIQALKEELESEARAREFELKRPESSHGRRAEDTPGLSQAPSSSRIGVAGLDAGAPQEVGRDDYGSSLTHGTDIVFAGNVTSALRRHRSETEGGESTAAAGLAQTATAVKYPSTERPSTPARESITATLDRAHELEKHKSRDAILHELKAWRMETAGASIVGVVSMDDPSEVISPSASPTKRPPSSSGRPPSSTERRPNTSAGILRNGNVREAFVDSASKSRPIETPMAKRRSSSSLKSSSSSSPSVPTSSTRNVDILILDEEPQHDDQRPCSPRKTSRGVFTTATRSGGDWNLEEIAPKLDLQSTESFLHRSSRRKSVGEDEGDFSGSDSDADDLRSVARQLKQRKAASSSRPPTHAKTKGFFNVTESLHAIDKWREQMEENLVADPSSQRKQRGESDAERRPSGSSESSVVVGLACRSSDEQIVQWMKEKHASVADIKTREGFRRFFRGIEEPRLSRILHQVFSDPEKVRRRLQLMQGFYSGQTCSS